MPKYAPVRASATAPSMAKTLLVVLFVICGETPLSTRHSEDRAVTIDDGDDRIVHIGGRGRALQKRTARPAVVSKSRRIRGVEPMHSRRDQRRRS